MPPTPSDALLRASLERRYEGRAVLDRCLARAGATYTAEEAEEELQAAAAAGATPDEVFPILFHDEPELADAEQARRLYSNLFGLWDAVSGQSLPLPDDPEPTAVPGEPLPAALVEAAWRETDLLPTAELRAEWDRFANAQPDVLLFVQRGCEGLPDEAVDTATMVAFEMWRAFRRAFGPRLPALHSRDLDRWRTSDAPETEPEPALAAFAAEALELATMEGEDPGPVAPVLDRLRWALSAGWSRPRS